VVVGTEVSVCVRVTGTCVVWTFLCEQNGAC